MSPNCSLYGLSYLLLQYQAECICYYSVAILAKALGPVHSIATSHSLIAMDLSLRIPPRTLCMCLHDLLPHMGGYVACRAGDFVWITTVQSGDAEGAFGRNLRTQMSGWLPDVSETAIRVVTCHGDVAMAGEHFTAPSSGKEPLRSLAREPQPYELVGSTLGSGQTDCVGTLPSVAASNSASGPISLFAREPQPYESARQHVAQSASSSGTKAGSLNATRPPHLSRQQCSRCYRTTEFHDADPDSDVTGWCLQAQGWNRKRGAWRCHGCHSQPQNCLAADLGSECVHHRDEIFQFPPELGEHHGFIRDFLDLHVQRFIEFRCDYMWTHEVCGGQHPKSSPTLWNLTDAGCHIFSKIDFFRPAADWSNRRWCEVARCMPLSRSTAGFNDAWTRASTLASWMESFIGIVYVVGTGGLYLPAGNMIYVRRAPAWESATTASFMACLHAVWRGLEHIGVQMPAFETNRLPAIFM